MISLDQILLLQEKVENAVAKIAQLNAENSALRRKCAELTNALAAETEQFSAFQNNQSKIEEGILSALKKLDTVESKVLETSASSVPSSTESQNDSVPDGNAEKPQIAENIENSGASAEEAVQPAEDYNSSEKSSSNVLENEKVKQDVSPAVLADSDDNSGSVERTGSIVLNPNQVEQNSENLENSQEDSPSQPMFDIF